MSLLSRYGRWAFRSLPIFAYNNNMLTKDYYDILLEKINFLMVAGLVDAYFYYAWSGIVMIDYNRQV